LLFEISLSRLSKKARGKRLAASGKGRVEKLYPDISSCRSPLAGWERFLLRMVTGLRNV
jgi:hypothetical protein